MDGADRHLGLDRPITRRDFLNGVALGLGGSLASAVAHGVRPVAWRLRRWSRRIAPRYYPPALTGMRGSHDGVVGAGTRAAGRHVLAAGRHRYRHCERLYDLVVVGSGISGLAAAYFFRQQAGNDARILLLDNHDDFGGHATRNEFRVGGQTAARQRRDAGDCNADTLQPTSARTPDGAGDRSRQR